MPRVGKLMDRKRLSRPKYSVQYTSSGHIDVGRTLAVLRDSHVPDLELIAMLRAVWADAYAHGWSDGQRDADPNARRNPYGT